MRNGWTPVAVMLLALFLGAFGAWAGEGYNKADQGAVRTMAGIVLHMNHYPDDAEKARLEAIINDEAVSKPERIIATAIRNIEHSAPAADRERLRAIADDSSVPAPVRDLARAVLGFEHQPSAEAKAKLRAILGG